jgi:hypothetical protein
VTHYTILRTGKSIVANKYAEDIRCLQEEHSSRFKDIKKSVATMNLHPLLSDCWNCSSEFQIDRAWELHIDIFDTLSFIHYFYDFISFQSISTMHYASKPFSEVHGYVINPFKKCKWPRVNLEMDSTAKDWKIATKSLLLTSASGIQNSLAKPLRDVIPSFKTIWILL